MTNESDQDRQRVPGRSPGNEPGDSDPTRIRRNDGVTGHNARPDSWDDLSADGLYTSIPPQTILSNTHRIIEFIRRGGMGEVYRAYNQATGQENAIKIILPELASDPTVVEMFRREAEALRRVRNDAVVDYEGLFRDERGRLYLAMEFVDGPSLVDFMKNGPLTSDQIRGLRDRLALGLASAHDRGVFHRDLTPDNIILRDGNLEAPKIIDFGIAKFADTARETLVGSNFAGKYSFVSPEQLGMFGGIVDARSDIYSLGLVLAAVATGHPLPMGRTHAAVMESRLKVPDLSQVPPDLRDELTWMLQPNPDNRPQSMRELVTDHSGASQPKPGGVGSGRKSSARADRSTGNPAGERIGRGSILVALSLLALAGAGGGYYYQALLDRPGLPPQQQAEVPSSQTLPVPNEAPAQQTAVDPEPIKAELGRIFEQFDCSGLTADVAGTQGAFHVTVSGYLPSEADRSLLDSRLAGVPGLSRFDNLAEIQPKPFCSILDIIQTKAVPGGPMIRPDHGSRPYFEGEALIVTVTSAASFDGFLYVDLFDAQGNVIHLLPTVARKENRVLAGEELTIGTTRERARPGERYYEVEAPFGRNMMVAVSSVRSLFNTVRPEVEPATSYLADLQQRLRDSQAAMSGSGVMTSYEVIVTSARDAKEGVR